MEVIIISVLAIIVGRYVLAEGRRAESQKKFMKNMNNYESGRSENDPVSVWNKHKRRNNGI